MTWAVELTLSDTQTISHSG